jgi:pimeloyl-ACP methyl ester carboxylesterase
MCSLRRTLSLIGLVLLCCLVLSVPVVAQQVVTGTTANGAIFELDVPANWNGHLWVYAHGVVDPQAPIALPDVTPLKSALLAQGFAFATSSYSQNGYAVKQAAQDIHQLKNLFTAHFGLPVRTYLLGHSLGGGVVQDLAERFPGQYDGALPICGLVGGGLAQIQYDGNARVAFDYFFPGTLPGNAVNTPLLNFSPGSPAFNAVLGALLVGLNPPNFPTLQFANVARLPGSNPADILTSGLLVAGFSARFTQDLLERTHDHNPFDNTATVYTGSFNDAALNAGVGRFSAEPDALQYLEKYYTPTGELHIPMLTLHTTADPIVPFAQEAAYAQIVANAGASNSKMLVQQSVNRYGHCNVNAKETANALQGLFLWVNFGVMPPSGDVTVH